MTSSPGSRIVTPDRTKNASSGIRRVALQPGRDDDRAVDEERRAPCPRPARRCTRFPASVARFRIWTEPTTAAASASAAMSRRMTGWAAISVIVVVAPITSPPSAPARIPGASSGTPFTSTTTDGAYDPSRSRITRSVPPASTRAPAAVQHEQVDGLGERGGSGVRERLHRWSIASGARR